MPIAAFASSVKVDWSADPQAILGYAEKVASSALATIRRDRCVEWKGLRLSANGNGQSPMRRLGPEQSKLLIKGSISPIPLHKTLVLLDEIERHGDVRLRKYGRLALAKALAFEIGNLKFGPEVGLGRIKEDAPVVDVWLDGVRAMAKDIN